MYDCRCIVVFVMGVMVLVVWWWVLICLVFDIGVGKGYWCDWLVVE